MTALPYDILSPRSNRVVRLRWVALTAVVAGLGYGAAMGAFPGEASLVEGARPWQMFYSAIKVPLLLGVTFLVALPSFFILNTLLGVQEDFLLVLRGLASTQASLTLILLSFAPLTLGYYVSSSDYDGAITLNGVFFLAASLTAQVTLARHYRPLIARRQVHRVLLKVWLVLYSFVGIQSAWTLRPFIGSPDKPTTFFRQNAWGNAYEELAHIVLRALR